MVVNLLNAVKKEKVTVELDKMSWKGGKQYFFFQLEKRMKCCS